MAFAIDCRTARFHQPTTFRDQSLAPFIEALGDTGADVAQERYKRHKVEHGASAGVCDDWDVAEDFGQFWRPSPGRSSD